MGETSKYAHLVTEYTHGIGVDIGCGDDPLPPAKFYVDFGETVRKAKDPNDSRVLRPTHYTDAVYDLPAEMVDLDFVYASHMLEDYPREEWVGIVRRWSTRLKEGGYIILLLPERGRFREAVRQGKPDNLAHRYEPVLGEVAQIVLTAGHLRCVVEKMATDDPAEYTLLAVFQKVPQAMTKDIGDYPWYQDITLPDGRSTRPHSQSFLKDLWSHIEKGLAEIDFTRKVVLDIGARDCRFSLFAEKQGAAEIDAIDTDINSGVNEFLLPQFNSRINYHFGNVYDYSTATKFYDVVLFMGVLYHLRFPFYGLWCAANCVKPKGELVIETALLVEEELQLKPLLWCPVTESPYEPSSCTFFNIKALDVTLGNWGFKRIEMRPFGVEKEHARALIRFVKIGEPDPILMEYWLGKHIGHTKGK